MRSVAEIKKDFLNDLEKWQNIVYEYGLSDLQKQPGPNQWSTGQVINHLVEETDWYFSQARKAMADIQHLQKSSSAKIQEWFEANSFPNKRFKGPEDMEQPHQPISIKELIEKIEGIKNEIPILANEISKAGSGGKSQHPGHQFLTAHEWFQYAEMHCRHHFGQKDRIEKPFGTDSHG